MESIGTEIDEGVLRAHRFEFLAAITAESAIWF